MMKTPLLAATLGILAWTTSANAQQIIQAAPYFNEATCEKILNLRPGETFESVILDGLTSKEQAYQLLYDYKLVFSELHESAVRHMINQTGAFAKIGSVESIAAKISTMERNADAIQAAIKIYDGLLDFKGKAGREKITALLASIETLAATEGSAPNQGLVSYARVRNLVSALKNLPDEHPVIRALSEYTQATLTHTYVEMLQARKDYLVNVRKPYWEKWVNSGQRIGKVNYFMFTAGSAGLANLWYYGAFSESNVNVPTNIYLTIASILWGLSPPIYGIVNYYRIPSIARKLDRQATELSQQHRLQVQFKDQQRTAHAAISRSGRINFEQGDDGSSLEVAASRPQIVDFTPVEIAYLGDAEMITLKNDYEMLMKDFGRHPKDIEEAKQASRALSDDPTNYQKQVDFMSILEKLVGSRDLTTIRNHWDKFIADVNRMKARLEKVEELPYLIRDKKQNPYAVNLGRFLAQRLDRDFAEMIQNGIEAANLESSLDSLASDRQKLETILKSVGHRRSDWKAAADEAELILETLVIDSE